MSSAPTCTWRSLGAGPQELNLHLTMPTGQSFRWRKTGPDAYTGVIGTRVVQLRQLPGDVEFRVVARGAVAPPEGDAEVLADYFNLRFQLAELTKDWAARDDRFREVSPYFPGARMLRQDPMECLFQFICSSNNHISRIHGMVERLCSTYGTPLTSECPISDTSPPAQQQQQEQQHDSRTAAVATAPCTASPAAAYGAGPSTSPFAASAAMPVAGDAPASAAAAGAAASNSAASGAAAAGAAEPGAPSTPAAMCMYAPGELATPRLVSALAHVADDVAEARVDGGSEPGFATPAVAAGGRDVAQTAGASVHEGKGADAAGGGAEATAGATGSHLAKEAGGVHAAGAGTKVEDGDAGAQASDKGEGEGVGADGLSFYAFPTLEQLEAATEEELRAAGFGYRAKFITGTVQELKCKPGGGAAWLMSLRTAPFAEAVEALCTLPGVGPKVAACICLFSLDKHDAIPVDTHVWQLATRYYAPQLAGKALTPKLHGVVQEVFVERFGPYAGWAHNTLFISELASHRGLLPEQLRSPLKGERRRSTGGGGKRRSSSAGLGGDVTGDVAGDAVAGQAVTGEAVTDGRGKRRSSSAGTGSAAVAGSASDTALASPTAGGAGGSGGSGKRRRSRSGVGGGAAAQAAMLAAADTGDVAGDIMANAVFGTAGLGGTAGAGIDASGVGSQLEKGSQALRRGSRARRAPKRAASEESGGAGDEGGGVANEGQLGSQASLGQANEVEQSAPGSSKRRRQGSSDA